VFVAIASDYWVFHMQLDILQVVSPQCSLICPRQSYEKKIRVAGPAEQDMQFLDLWLRLWRSKEGRDEGSIVAQHGGNPLHPSPLDSGKSTSAQHSNSIIDMKG
jgi:hypothetical protein